MGQANRDRGLSTLGGAVAGRVADFSPQIIVHLVTGEVVDHNLGVRCGVIGDAASNSPTRVSMIGDWPASTARTLAGLGSPPTT
jgi:hypothetical protein